MAKKARPLKCEKCNLEFPASPLSEEHKHKAFVWKGKVMCEDCLLKMGTSLAEAETWSSFVQRQQPERPQKY